ncbi:hypothetical protein SISSUDRAFT_995525, partial [Sistotremastrum suecicum HHB10207 ss-3]
SRHPNKTVARVANDNSTSNLNSHVKKCEPTATAESRRMEGFAAGSSYRRERMRWMVVQWVAKKNRPLAIIEDEELEDIFRMLYASVHIPCRQTISIDLKNLYDMTRNHIKIILGDYVGVIHIGTDGWTARNLLPFLAIIASRVVDGQIESFLLDFVR